MRSAHSRIAAAGLTALFALGWAFIEAIASGLRVPALEVVWTRYGVHLLLLVLLFGRLDRSLVKTQRPVVQAFRSLLMLGMPMSYLAALSRMGGNDAMAVFWLAPLGLLLSTGPHPRRVWIAALAAYAGVLLIAPPDARTFGAGAIFALAMAACFAGYVRLTALVCAEGEATNLFHTALWVFAALSVRVPFVWQPPSSAAWTIMAIVGLAGLLSLYVLDVALRTSGTTIAAQMVYTQPVFVVMFNVLRAGSMVGRRETLGITLVLTAAMVVLAVPGSIESHDAAIAISQR